MKYCLYIVLMSFVVIGGCNVNHHKEHSTKPRQSKLETIEMELLPLSNFSTLFKLENFLILKISKDNPIGEISKLLYTETRLFLLDKTQDYVYILNRSGDQLALIQNKGLGPLEYSSLDDILWDKNKNQLLAIDRGGKKLFYFDEDGSYLLHKKLDFKPFAFLKTGVNFWFYTANYGTMANYDNYSKEHYSLILTDTMFNVLSLYHPINKQLMGYSFSNSTVSTFANSDYKNWFAEFYSDTIKELVDGVSYDRYFLDFGDKIIPSKIREYHNPQELTREIVEGGYSYVTGCYALDNNLIVECDKYYLLINDEIKSAVKFSRYENDLSTSTKYLGQDTYMNNFAVFSPDFWDIKIKRNDGIYKELDVAIKKDDYPYVLLYYKYIY